jgi:hypothetical protein
MAFWIYPAFWIAVIIFVSSFLIWIFPGGSSLFGYTLRTKPDNGSAPSKEYDVLQLLKPYYIIGGAAITFIFLLYGIKNGTVALYEKEVNSEKAYDWLNPIDLLSFPADQLSRATDVNFSVPEFNLEESAGAKNHYSLVFSDLSLSANDRVIEKASQEFSSRIDEHIANIQRCDSIDVKLSIKQKLPLLILLDQSRNQSIASNTSKISVLCYWGKQEVRTLFRNYWDVNLSKKNFCNDPIQSAFITQYNSHMREWWKLSEDSGGTGRTDFDFILREITNKIFNEPSIENDPNAFVSVSIISDFAHEVTYKKYPIVSFTDVELSFNKLIRKDQIKQVLLIVVPVSLKQQKDSTVSKRIDSLITCLKINGQTKVKTVYLNNIEDINKSSRLQELLSQTATCTSIDSSKALSFYYTATKCEDNRSSIKIQPISEDGDSIFFRFYTTKKTDAEEVVLRMKVSRDESHTFSAGDSKWYKIRESKTILCNLIHATPFTDNLYLDIYSPKTSQKKQFKIILKQLLPRSISIMVVIAHVLLLTTACICFTFLTWFYMKKSSQRFALLRYTPFALSMATNVVIFFTLAGVYWQFIAHSRLSPMLILIGIILLAGIIATLRLCKKVNNMDVVTN